MLRQSLLVALMCLLIAAPAATAHTAVYSADNRVRASAGLLNEPTSTYAVTGLDLCFTENTTASPRPPITGINPGALTVVLRAPGGQTHTSALSVPFGRANCVAFETPLVLTEPGQYLMDISGSINGTTFSATDVKAGGAVRDRATITFPEAGVIADHVAQERIEALEAKIASLEAQVAGLQTHTGTTDSKGAPSLAPALLLATLAFVALIRRRSE